MDFYELQHIVSVCLDNIVSLKEENEKLRENINQIEKENKEIIEMQGILAKGIKKLYKDDETIETKLELLTNTADNLKYEILDDREKDKKLKFPRFYSIEDTIKEIVLNKKSMARFGDGEFSIMCNHDNQKFQRCNGELANRLCEVIKSKEEGLLVAIADNYGALDKYSKMGKSGIRFYMSDDVRREHWAFLDEQRIYHDAYISRPYVLYKDNGTDAPRKRFDNLRSIWNQRKVIFIEGALTRLGVGNDLFDNAKQIRRIIGPGVNSYDKYEEILKAALHYAEEDILFLIALGPSAGVLAYDLYKAGYQAIDVGHVDLEYEWYLRGKQCRCEVKNKYNNEYQNGDIVDDVEDMSYFEQILCTIE